MRTRNTSAVVARGQNVAERERHDQTRLLHPTRQLLVGTATINEQDLAGDEACPNGWLCHAVRAFGPKVTSPPEARPRRFHPELGLDAHRAGEAVGRSLLRACEPLRTMVIC